MLAWITGRDVRFGSLEDIRARTGLVCFTPIADIRWYHPNLNEETPRLKETCGQRNQATVPAPSLTRELTHHHLQLQSLADKLNGSFRSPEYG